MPTHIRIDNGTGGPMAKITYHLVSTPEDKEYYDGLVRGTPSLENEVAVLARAEGETSLPILEFGPQKIFHLIPACGGNDDHKKGIIGKAAREGGYNAFSICGESHIRGFGEGNMFEVESRPFSLYKVEEDYEVERERTLDTPLP